MSIEKEFVPCEIALELKELEFDEPCAACYGSHTHKTYELFLNINNPVNIETLVREKTGFNRPTFYVKAPTFSQAFSFFREEHKLSCSIELTDNSRHYYFDFTIYDSKNRDYNDEDCFDSCRRTYDNRKYGKHEEAELECLKKLIEIAKK